MFSTLSSPNYLHILNVSHFAVCFGFDTIVNRNLNVKPSEYYDYLLWKVNKTETHIPKPSIKRKHVFRQWNNLHLFVRLYFSSLVYHFHLAVVALWFWFWFWFWYLNFPLLIRLDAKKLNSSIHTWMQIKQVNNNIKEK